MAGDGRFFCDESSSTLVMAVDPRVTIRCREHPQQLGRWPAPRAPGDQRAMQGSGELTVTLGVLPSLVKLAACVASLAPPGDICWTLAPSTSVLGPSSGRKCLYVEPSVCGKVSLEQLPWSPGDRAGISHPKATVTSEIVIIQTPSVFDSRPTISPLGLGFLIKLDFRIY